MKKALFTFALLLPSIILAGGYHHSPVVNNYYPSETTITTGIDNAELSKGIALALAGQHQFDFDTVAYQGSIVGAWYDDENAVSFGLAKRFRKLDALFHTSYSENGSEGALVFGGTFRF